MSYDEVPYPSLPIVQTHPERSATAATLLGMAPAAVDRCRVLELGCASGGNLLPLAVALPGSEFLGIDLSARQIAEGQLLITNLALGNVALQKADLLALAGEASALGEFDYIICHGVYSWVPAPVQRAILTICQRHLAPHGIAYISYNTLPGFYRRQPLRDLMLFHREHNAQLGRAGDADKALLAGPAVVRESRALVDLMLQGVADKKGSWAHILQEEADVLRSAPDGYVFHDHLEADNNPCYFHQFAAAAKTHGLQFLAEAEPLGTLDRFPPAVQQRLKPFRQDVVVLEQYLDFLRGQSFRCTLLCRAEVSLTREPPLKRLQPLWVSCASWPAAASPPTPADLRSAAGVTFRSRQQPVVVSDPALKAVLWTLCEKEPRALAFSELGAGVTELLGKTIAEPALAELLLYGYRAGVLRLHVAPPRFALSLSERPLGSPLARRQAQTQSQVANLRHQIAELSPLERLVLPLLDGAHDLPALLPPLLEAVRSGALVIERGKSASRDGSTLRQVLTKQLEATLQTLAGCALLIA